MMKKIFKILWLVSILALGAVPNKVWSFSSDPIQHRLRIELEPSSRFARIEARSGRLLEGGPQPVEIGAERVEIHRDRTVARDDVTHAGVPRRSDPGRQRHDPRIDDRIDPWLELDGHRRVANHPHPPVRHLI